MQADPTDSLESMPANTRIALGTAPDQRRISAELAPKANCGESDTDRENQGGMRLGNRMRRARFGSNRDRLPIVDGVEPDSAEGAEPDSQIRNLVRPVPGADSNATALDTAPNS